MTAAEGSILWQKDIKKEFGGHMMSGWGYSESPLIDGEKVVVTPGGKKAAMVALDKATGAKIWTCEIPKDSGAGYASIAKAEVGGIPMYITFLGKDPGLIGVNAKTGKFLWNDSKVANGTANAPTASVHGDYVFASSGYGTGAALLKLVPGRHGRHQGGGGVLPRRQQAPESSRRHGHARRLHLRRARQQRRQAVLSRHGRPASSPGAPNPASATAPPRSFTPTANSTSAIRTAPWP